MIYANLIISNLLLVATLILYNIRIYRILQQNSYNSMQTIKYFESERNIMYILNIFIFGFIDTLIMSIVYKILHSVNIYLSFIGVIIGIFNVITISDYSRPIVKLRLTKRCIRVITMSGLILLLFNALMLYLGMQVNIVGYGLMGITIVFDPIIVILSNIILSPFERANNLRYIKRAKKKYSEVSNNSKIVAITGSFGKTTTRNLISNVLQTKYSVFTPKKNYNTPMGLCLALKDIETNYDVLVLEFGADRVGDIDILSSIVTPDVSVLTGIGNQHLSTFGSIENILSEKSKILSYAKKYVVFDQNSIYRDTFYAYSGKKEKYLVGCDLKLISAINTISGLMVDFEFKGKLYTIHSNLFGTFNAYNILYAVLVGLIFNIPMNNIIYSIESTEPIPHRMERKELPTGAILIDDSYNINIAGAIGSLDVLGTFDDKRKVLITSGVIENYLDNIKLANKIDEVCDEVIILGERNKEILSTNIRRARKSYYMRFSDIDLNVYDRNCVILLHADFPDNYEV